MNKFLLGLVIVIAAGAVGIGYTLMPSNTFGNFSPTGGSTYTLQSSISSTQTTITLTSFLEPVSNIPYTMSYINTDIIYGTIAPSTGNSEFISATGITQNANGTATLTGVLRGLSKTPGTGGCVASTTLSRSWPGQTQFILSNSPCFYSEFAVKQNDEDITGTWTFASTSAPKYDATYTASGNEFVSFTQLNNTAIQGASTSTEANLGVVELATIAETAAGTASSSAGGPLVPKNSSFLQTWAAQVHVPVTSALGKISQSLLDLTQHFSFSSLFATNASSTNATTSTQYIGSLTGILKATSGLVGTAVSGEDYAKPQWMYATTTGHVFATGGSQTATSSYFTIPAGLLTASSTIEFYGGINSGTGGCTPT